MSTAQLISIGLLLLLGAFVLVFSGIFVFRSGAIAQKQQATQTPKTHATQTPTPMPQTMPVGDIPGWHQIFTDDFTTNVPLGSFPAAVANKWTAYPDGWPDTFRNGEYYPSKVVSINNGILNINVHTEDGIHMVAAIEPKLPGATGQEGGLLYGRYVMRFRADPVDGYKIAGLLWPDSEAWPRDGEIDFPETHLDGTVSAFAHLQNGTKPDDQVAYLSNITISSWHIATIEWTPNRLTFMIDNVVIGSTITRIPDTPMHWIIQIETTTAGPSNTTASNVQIDWVAVYTPSSTASIQETPSSGNLLAHIPDLNSDPSFGAENLSLLPGAQIAYIQEGKRAKKSINLSWR